MDIVDSNYENNTSINIREKIIVKKYQHFSRMLCEQRALIKLNREKIVPHFIESDFENKTIKISFLDGKNPSPEFLFQKLPLLCESIEKIHKYHTTWSGYLCSPSEISWKNYILRKYSSRYEMIRPYISNIELIDKFFLSEFSKLSFEKNNCLLHYDLKPANIIFNKNKNRFNLIDFDRALFGDPLMDYSKLWWRAWNIDSASINKLEKCLEEYYEIDNDFQELMLFYTQLHCIGALAYYTSTFNSKYRPIVNSAMELTQNIIDTRIRWKV